MPPDLNSATVPVASQSTTDLHPALVAAFNQALIKITGNSAIVNLADVQKQLPSVEKFVQKYSYLDSSVKVTFDQHALVTLLVQAQQPIWLSARPASLLWVSVNGQPPLTVPADNSLNAPVAALQNSAANRAIPIVFPTMDANDQAAWQAKTSGTALDQAALTQIAARYQTPALLYGELTQAPDQSWTANWFLVWRAQTWQWRNDGAEDAVLQAGIDKMTDVMGSQLAINLDQQAANTLWVAIMGVNNLNDYNAVLTALKEFQPILGISVQDVGSHGVLLQVTTVGEGPDALKQALAASPHFTPLPAQATEVLTYQWKP